MTNATQLLGRVQHAVETLDRKEASDVAEETSDAIRAASRTDSPFPSKEAANILGALRRKRYFPEMQLVTDALLETGNDDVTVRRQYLQSMIDRGDLATARGYVDGLVNLAAGSPKESAEARGLRGRILKQSYVDAGPRPSIAIRHDLDEAIRQYEVVYREDPKVHYWHGINVVACLHRAHRDGVETKSGADKDEIAQAIVAHISKLDRRETYHMWAWATAMEASVALGNVDDAAKWLELYIQSPLADAFELNATYRQLTEVWQLDPKGPWGPLLTALRGALLQSSGGQLQVVPADILAADAAEELEAIWGPYSFQTAKWLARLLRKIQAVGRVERPNGGPVGSGFVVRGEELHSAWRGQLMFVTNAHVVNDPPHPDGISPSKARINLTWHESSGDGPIRIEQQWSSPADQLDVSVHSFRNLPDGVESLELARADDITPDDSDASPQLIVAGHPDGGDLSITLQNNHLDHLKSPKVYYNSPTKRGNSGSPVLTDDLAAVAVHRAAKSDLEVNEGVLTEAVRRHLAESPPDAA